MTKINNDNEKDWEVQVLPEAEEDLQDIPAEEICTVNIRENCMIVRGRVQGIPVDFLVDTGASCSLISGAIFEGLPGLEEKKSVMGRRFQLADGTPLKAYGACQVAISLGTETVQHTVIGADISDPGILGYDFLKAQGCLVDLDQGKFLIKGVEIPVVQDTEELEPKQECEEKHCLKMAAVMVDTDIISGVQIMNQLNEPTKIRAEMSVRHFGDVIMNNDQKAVDFEVSKGPDKAVNTVLPEFLAKLHYQNTEKLSKHVAQPVKKLLIKDVEAFQRHKEDLEQIDTKYEQCEIHTESANFPKVTGTRPIPQVNKLKTPIVKPTKTEQQFVWDQESLDRFESLIAPLSRTVHI